MENDLVTMCPFRNGTASKCLFMALARSGKVAKTHSDLSRQTKIPLKKTSTLLAAMSNPYHNAGLRRAGVTVERVSGKFVLKITTPHPNAKRKAR